MQSEVTPATDARATNQPPLRWWPAVLVLVLAGVAVIAIRWAGDSSHQERNLRSMGVGFLATLLLLVWALAFSRFRRRVKWAVLGCALGVAGMSAALFKIEGVSGDLLPILRFRWQRPAPIPVATTQAPPTVPAPAPSETNSFPQFLGPHRNATLPDGPRLARNWTTRPPQELWRRPVGAAWSGFVVAGQRAVTHEQRGAEETVACYELRTGQPLWTHADKTRYASTIAGVGPRATPTIAGDRVLTLGATGLLNCLDLATGRLLWSRQIITENQSKAGEWGVTGAPLVFEDRVMVNPGGCQGRSLVAYRLSDGELVWAGGDDEASYSAPFATTLCGARQILILNQHALFGHDAATGRVLWQHSWPGAHPKVALPVVVSGDRVLISSGYGAGAALLQVTRDGAGAFSASRLWKNTRLKAKFNNPVTRDGFVYGLDDGILVCLEIATGEIKWKEGRYGHGQFLLVRDTLLLTAENGEVVLLDPVPTGRRELAKLPVFTSKTWNPPALAGDLLLVRNDREAACVRLPVEP
ncbi:MAG: PQQ-like beta-propeller repeat protein [Verrucomicrobia bacterium]|nr:PQQ-like beta-propeller repeat protein [Verrucomicrobiota bacterium]